MTLSEPSPGNAIDPVAAAIIAERRRVLEYIDAAIRSWDREPDAKLRAAVQSAFDVLKVCVVRPEDERSPTCPCCGGQKRMREAQCSACASGIREDRYAQVSVSQAYDAPPEGMLVVGQRVRVKGSDHVGHICEIRPDPSGLWFHVRYPQGVCRYRASALEIVPDAVPVATALEGAWPAPEVACIDCGARTPSFRVWCVSGAQPLCKDCYKHRTANDDPHPDVVTGEQT